LERENPCSNNCTTEIVILQVNQRYLVFPQYNTPHYSNLGMSILGHALGAAAEQPFEKYVTEQILTPLGMLSSTFDLSPSTIRKMAMGVSFGPDGKYVPARLDVMTAWDNPAGGLIASHRDMAKLMSFMFREDTPAGGKQIFDSSSTAQMLLPVLMTHDGVIGFGSPWEQNYTFGYWTKSKQGELPGYRSNLVIVPDLKIGVLVTALIDNTPDPTVYAMTMLGLIIPAFENVLKDIYVPPPLPPSVQLYLGNFTVDGYTTRIFLNGNTIVMIADSTYFLSIVPFDPNVLRAAVAPPLPECRWLDDSYNNEFVYFTFPGPNKPASQINLAGMTFVRV